jgi:uncharacterized membrane protein YhfC
MQVSVLSIIFMMISAFISIGLPIFLFVIIHKKYNGKILPLIFGIIGFILFVLILERSIHLIVLNKFMLREKPFLFIIYGIFMAGIFEESARFISFNIIKKKFSGISTGLYYGIGHGGIESILLAGLAMINNIVFSIIINTGGLDSIITAIMSNAEKLEQVNNQVNALITTAPYLFFIGGIERIFAIGIQMSLSIIVYHSVFSKNKIWLYPLAILFHAIIDIPAAAMQAGILKNIFLVEGIILLGTILLILFTKYLHDKLSQE